LPDRRPAGFFEDSTMMTDHPTWIDHFPDNFTWSNAMLVTKGMAPYGAVALEETITSRRVPTSIRSGLP
jgi:hypothetical protein